MVLFIPLVFMLTPVIPMLFLTDFEPKRDRAARAQDRGEGERQS